VNGSTTMRALLGFAVGFQGGRMNPGAELALAGVGRLGHDKLLGPAVSATFQPPSLAQRIPRTPVAASADTPKSHDVSVSGGSGASPSWVTCWQAGVMEVSRDAGPGPIVEYLVEQGG